MFTALLTISLLHWVVLITPGVNFVLIAQLAANGQRKTAVMATLGITTVTLMWAILAILGLGVLFSTHPLLRQLLQTVGGLYLLKVALQLWRSTSAGTSEQALTPAAQTYPTAQRHSPAWAAYQLGFITNVFNPKTALFFGSVFATALPAQPSLWLMGVAIVMVYANALVWHLLLAIAFSNPWVRQAYEARRHVLNRLAALVVGGFAVQLLLGVAREWLE